MFPHMPGPGWACVLALSPPTALSTVGVWAWDPGTVVPTLTVVPDLAIFLLQLLSKPHHRPCQRTHHSPLPSPCQDLSQTPSQPPATGLVRPSFQAHQDLSVTEPVRTTVSPSASTVSVIGLFPVSPLSESLHRTCQSTCHSLLSPHKAWSTAWLTAPVTMSVTSSITVSITTHYIVSLCQALCHSLYRCCCHSVCHRLRHSASPVIAPVTAPFRDHISATPRCLSPDCRICHSPVTGPVSPCHRF